MSRDDNAPGFRPLDRNRAAAHDRHFADDFVDIPGAARHISITLARKLGYHIEAPAWSAGGEPDDGEIGDTDQGPSQQAGR
jgi:hypothetical protein